MGFDPGTLAAMSMVASGASAGIQAIGAEQQASAQAQAMNYQAAIAQNNQIIANQNATYAEQVGQTQEQEKRRQTAALISEQRAAMGANGVNPDVGSGVDVQSSAKEMGELDALTIRSNAAKTATGYRDQGVNYAAQAGADSAAASNALTAGNLNAVSSLLSGGSSVSDKWSMYKTQGVL